MERTGYQVRVTGIPEKLKIAALLRLIHRVNVRTKQVNVSMLAPNSGVKDVILTFPSNYDAQMAVQNLENHVFEFHQETYVLNAYMEREYNHVIIPPSNNQKKNNKFNKWRKGKYRPNYKPEELMESQALPVFNSKNMRNESFELDKKIEILKKQRMILEEERKLLEEKRKLEAFRMHAGNASSGEQLTTPIPKNGQKAQPTKSAKAGKKPVQYFKATGVLVWKMSEHVNKYATPENRRAFLARLRLAIRNRILAVVDEQPIYYTNKVIELYRSHHPESEDESFVKELMEKLDDAAWLEDEAMNAELAKDGSDAGDDENKIENQAEVKTKKTTQLKHFNRKVFYKLGKVLLNKLNPYIDKHVAAEKRRLIAMMLRQVLRERLIDVIDENKHLYGMNQIINMYRKKHQVEKDEELVLEVLKKIEDNNWGYDDIKKLYSPSVSAEEGGEEAAVSDAGQMQDNSSGADLYDPENPGEDEDENEEGNEEVDTKNVDNKTEKDTNNVETEKDTNNVETEKDTNNIETEKDTNNIETEKDINNIETEKGTNNIETEKDTNNVETEKGTNNIETEKDTNNVEKEKDTNKVETEKYTNNVETEKESTETVNNPDSENRGVKRRGSVVEEIEEKVAKISDGNETNDYEFADENDLEDWN